MRKENSSRESSSGRKQGKGGTLWFAVLILLVNIMVSILIVYIYDRHYATHIVALDLRGYIAEQRDLYLRGKIDDEKFKKNIDHIEHIIGSIPRNRVILMGDVVLGNAEKIEP